MYKRNSKILAVLLTIVLVFSIFPSLRVNAAASGTCGAQGDNVSWTLDDEGTLTISGTGATAGYSIGADSSGNVSTSAPWFAYKDSLTKINIENGVTSIGGSNFAYLSNVVDVTIPNSVTSIGYSEFAGCTSLTGITIPNSVTSIGYAAFFDCTSLTSITIPDSVASIDDRAFRNCTSLTNVTMTQRLYDNINTTNVFQGISPNFNLIPSGYCGDPSVNGGKDVTWIFDDTTGTLTISGTGATAGYSIGGDSSGNVYSSAPWFAYKDSLTKIIIENGVTSIGGFNFAYLSNVVDVTISNSVTSIGYGAFNTCTSLTGITIPDSITTIGNGAFAGCTSLSSITIPDGVTSIGDGAFTDCTSLTSITIPDSVISIGIGAFDYCTSLTSITIPDTVTSIGISAFYSCTSLESITLPDSITTIGIGAFEYCTSLKTISIPDSVTSIDSYTFKDCTSLTSITIPDSVTSIGNCAFEDCTSLTSITIPDSVISIGLGAFEDCTSLTDVTMSKTLYDDLVQKGTLNYVFSGITLPSIHFYYTVDYKSNGNGTISGTTTQSFGTDQIELTIQPDSNYVLDKIEWSDGTNSGVLTESNGKYVMPDSEAGAVTLTASFKLDQKTVTFKNEDGTVLQSGAVDYGTNPAYTGATPAKAEDDKYTYTFAGWSDGTKTYGPTNTLPAVTDDVTYTATFTETAKPTPEPTTPTPASTTPDPTTPTPVPVSKPGTYYLSSMLEKDGNIVITIKMSEDDTKTFDLLGTVTSDGVALTEGNQYTATKGSAIITINKSFLDTLAAGTHKLTVTFTDGGSITIDYEVKAPAAAPQAAAQAVQATGEAVSAASIAGACLILAAAGIAFTVTRKRKEEA